MSISIIITRALIVFFGHMDFIIGKTSFSSLHSDLKGRIFMGVRKKVSRAKSPVSVRDPHYSEFDTHKERNIQKPLPRITP